MRRVYNFPPVADCGMLTRDTYIYKSTLKTVVFGYTGWQNTGDELLLSALRQGIDRRRLPISLNVLSRDPATTRRVHGVVCPDHPPFGGAIRPSLTTRWRRTRALIEADILLLGPGGGFQDYDQRGVRSMFATLRIAAIARMAGARVVVIGTGAGPLIRPWGRRITRGICALADLLIVRDQESAELLSALGVPPEKITIAADVAFSLPAREPSATRGPVLGVSIFDFHNYVSGDAQSAENQRRIIAGALDVIAAQGISMHFLSMQGAFGGRDEEEASRVVDCMEHKNATRIFPYADDPQDTWGHVAQCSWLVGMRYHSIVLAALSGVPFAALSYHPKVTSLMRQLQASNRCLQLAGLQHDSLVSLLQALTNEHVLPAAVHSARIALAQEAEVNFERLGSLCRDSFAMAPTADGGASH